MSEEEMYLTDLYTIYKLIDVHAEYAGVKPRNGKRKENKKSEEESVSYIDNVVF